MPLAPGRSSALAREAIAWLGPAAAAALCLVLTLPYFGHLADYDEFYTLLAARGWLEAGAPIIADGAYTRAEAFSLIQAAFFRVFGESMLVARLPSLLAVMALAAGLFVWVRRQVGTGSAAIATIVFACTPLTIETGQFSRFYALHGLTIGATALFAYYACLTAGRRRVALAAGGVVCLLVSLNLQPTTIIALCPIGIWVAASVVQALLRGTPKSRRRALIAGLVSLPVLAAAVLWLSGIGPTLWSAFQATPVWGSVPERAANVRYYHQTLDQELGLLWSLFPIAAVVAVSKRGRPMLFAALFVAVTLGLHSAAAQKDERYVFYILPFISMLLGVGLGAAISSYFTWLQRALPNLLGDRARFTTISRTAAALVVVSILFAYINNPPTVDVVRMLAGAPKTERLDYSWIANWPAELAAIEPIIEPPTVFVTSSGVKAVYYVEDYDFELNASVTDETDTRRDFGLDPRTGRQVLGSADAVERLLQCYSKIVFVIDKSRWSRDTAVPVATSALIEMRAEQLPTGPDSELLIFRASNGAATESSELCKELRPGRHQ